jgi:hypothetical protein
MKIVSNADGIKGGARLWLQDDLPQTPPAEKEKEKAKATK